MNAIKILALTFVFWVVTFKATAQKYKLYKIEEKGFLIDQNNTYFNFNSNSILAFDSKKMKIAEYSAKGELINQVAINYFQPSSQLIINDFFKKVLKLSKNTTMSEKDGFKNYSFIKLNNKYFLIGCITKLVTYGDSARNTESLYVLVHIDSTGTILNMQELPSELFKSESIYLFRVACFNYILNDSTVVVSNQCDNLGDSIAQITHKPLLSVWQLNGNQFKEVDTFFNYTFSSGFEKNIPSLSLISPGLIRFNNLNLVSDGICFRNRINYTPFFCPIDTNMRVYNFVFNYKNNPVFVAYNDAISEITQYFYYNMKKFNAKIEGKQLFPFAMHNSTNSPKAIVYDKQSFYIAHYTFD